MAFNFTLQNRARIEILEAINWYESRKTGLGKEFLTEVEAEIRRITEGPLLFPKFNGMNTTFRRSVLKKFPFVIIFSLYKDQVIIHSVFHTHQNPDKKPYF